MYSKGYQIEQQGFDPKEVRVGAEALQMVHYEVGQGYSPHHDWGSFWVRDGDVGSRFATVLLYLTDQASPDAGGETCFPHVDELALHPGKGSAILFYSVHPDGNMDEKSLHASLPVKEGEKWISNVWIWDPHQDEGA